MKSSDSQMAWVEEQVRLYGFITRNNCLKNYISRLSAIIFILEENGYLFGTRKRIPFPNGTWDYKYTATAMPMEAIYE